MKVYADTKTTFDNYRKEAERLLLWGVVQLGKPLSSLTHEDLLLFKAFIADPQPAERWISGNGGKYPRGDARCRWLTTLFYLQGMRFSEVAGGQMGNFLRRLGADGQDQWWLETLGKGDKERIVPASP